jgi:hypothetical protein
LLDLRNPNDTVAAPSTSTVQSPAKYAVPSSEFAETPLGLPARRRRLQWDPERILFVALVWLGQSYWLFQFIGFIGANIPYYDEWEMVPALTRARPITLGWLWSQHNEHRMFLSRLVYIAVVRFGHFDFRSGMYFDAGVLSLLAAACCIVARRVRGSTSYADAFFPLVLLHWGQAQNLDWAFQIAFVMTTAVVLAGLMLMVNPGALNWPAAFGLGVCTVLLPLMSGAGLALVPALGLCTITSAWVMRRTRPRRYIAWLPVLLLGLLGIALLIAYFINYHRPARHPVSPNFAATALATLKILTAGFGSGAAAYWHRGSGLFVLGLSLTTAALLLSRMLPRDRERPRALRLGLFLVGMVGLAGGIGWARVALFSGAPFESRYVTLSVPFLCAIYFCWELAPRWRIGQFIQMTLCLVAALLVVRNHEHGYREAAEAYADRQVVLKDIRSGTPRAEIVKRHCGFLYYVCGDSTLSDRMRMLRDAHAGDFSILKE